MGAFYHHFTDIPSEIQGPWLHLNNSYNLSKDRVDVNIGGNLGRTYKDKKGYPRWRDSGRLVHRTVASKKNGRPLGKGQVVHHKDGDKSNFRKSNLIVMSRSAHSTLHNKKKRR